MPKWLIYGIIRFGKATVLPALSQPNTNTDKETNTDMGDKIGVVSWFNVPGQEDKGVILELQNGRHWWLKGEDYDPAIKPQLIKDNIFEFDAVADPTPKQPKRQKVANLKFTRAAQKEEETSAYLEKNFPRQKKTTVGPQQPVKIVPESDPSRPVAYAVSCAPLDGENGTDWIIIQAVSARDKGRPIPLSNAPVYFGDHTVSADGTTAENGIYRHPDPIVVEDDSIFIGYCDSTLILPNIPLSGPENQHEQPVPKTGWARWNNWVWLVVFLGLFLIPLIYKSIIGFGDITTPYSQRVETSQSRHTDAVQDLLPWKQSKMASDPTSTSSYIWYLVPYTSWSGVFLGLLICVGLFPFSFYDEFVDAAHAAISAGKHVTDSLFQKRRAFTMRVEITPEGEKKYFLNGKEIDRPVTPTVLAAQKATITAQQMFKLFFAGEIIGDVLVKAGASLIKSLVGRR